jgi:membrane associated rhomboid family serine protease
MSNITLGKRKLKDVVMPLIFLNIGFFIVQYLQGDVFTNTFALLSQDVLTRPWTLLTSMFLHANSMHLLFNMYALFIFGPLVELEIGPKNFLIMYLGAGLLAGIIFSIFNPTSAAIGASGAIMAVLGMMIMLFPHQRVLMFFVIPMSLRTAGIIFAAIDLLGFVSSANTGIAHVAHLAGLAVGVTYGYMLVKNKRRRRRVVFKKTPSIDLTASQEEIDAYFKKKR